MAGSEVRAARVYLRVSTDEQDLTRQESIVAGARAAGFYVAAVYREKASGARPDRPELLRMVADLQPGEVVVAEKIDRISRLPLPEAELLVQTIRGRGGAPRSAGDRGPVRPGWWASAPLPSRIRSPTRSGAGPMRRWCPDCTLPLPDADRHRAGQRD